MVSLSREERDRGRGWRGLSTPARDPEPRRSPQELEAAGAHFSLEPPEGARSCQRPDWTSRLELRGHVSVTLSPWLVVCDSGKPAAASGLSTGPVLRPEPAVPGLAPGGLF